MTAPARLRFRLPIRTESAANLREHPQARAARVKKERQAASGRAPRWPWKPVAVITLTRVGPGTLDDDNLRPSLKSVRDGLADWLGFRDDSSPLLAWRYFQRLDREVDFHVEVDVELQLGAPELEQAGGRAALPALELPARAVVTAGAAGYQGRGREGRAQGRDLASLVSSAYRPPPKKSG